MGERRRKLRRKESSKAADERREADDRRAGKERRRDERVAAEVMVEVETSGRRTYRRTANISMGGVAFHQPIPFRQGSLVNLTLRLAGQKKAVQVVGEVVGTDKTGRGTRLRFAELTDKARLMLQTHLELFTVPTQIGVRHGAPPPDKERPSERVREGILIIDAKEGQEFRLRSSDKIIGRDPQVADFIINHASVSRRHAHIYLHNDRHVLADLSSTNGVHFRNKPIHTLVLKDGMVFKIGKVKVQYLVTRTV